jgi:Sulfotransferase family
MLLRERLRRREPSWRRAQMWVPAPQPVVHPGDAGIDRSKLAMPEALAPLAAPPVFITGSARSGTNFTLDLFKQHPDVCAIVESWILTQTHGLTSIFAQREWNPRASQSAFERVGMRNAAVQLLPYQDMIRELGDLLAGWLMRPVGTHRFVVAKEPLDVPATAMLFPEARFIHVIRDGRDVALSMRAASESWDASMGVGIPMSWRGEAWRRQVENVRAHRDFLGDRYLEIRFEDIRRDVKDAARRLFEFSEIPYDEGILERVEAGTRLESYSEAVRKSGFRGRGEVGGWRSRFGVRDAIGFNRSAGDLLVELGYEADRGWWRQALRNRLGIRSSANGA